MATAQVLKFMQRTAEDQALRQQLEALLGVGDGNISSEAELDDAESAALTGERAPKVAEFATQHGFGFSESELITVVNAFHKHQAGELSDGEFANLIGVSATNKGKKENLTFIAKPMKRLTRYLGKTYLGIGAPGA